MKVPLIAFCVACLTLQLSTASQSRRNPVRKVVNLLQKMQEELRKTQRKERNMHRKYMCNCKKGIAKLEKNIEEVQIHNAELQKNLETTVMEKKAAEEELNKATAERETTRTEMETSKAMMDKMIAEDKAAREHDKENLKALRVVSREVGGKKSCSQKKKRRHRKMCRKKRRERRKKRRQERRKLRREKRRQRRMLRKMRRQGRRDRRRNNWLKRSRKCGCAMFQQGPNEGSIPHNSSCACPPPPSTADVLRRIVAAPGVSDENRNIMLAFLAERQDLGGNATLFDDQSLWDNRSWADDEVLDCADEASNGNPRCAQRREQRKRRQRARRRMRKNRKARRKKLRRFRRDARKLRRRNRPSGGGGVQGCVRSLRRNTRKDLRKQRKLLKKHKRERRRAKREKKKQLKLIEQTLESKGEASGELAVEEVTLTNELSHGEKELNENKEQLPQMQADCKSRAEEWTIIRKRRRQELIAIAEVIRVLDGDAAERCRYAMTRSSLVQEKSEPEGEELSFLQLSDRDTFDDSGLQNATDVETDVDTDVDTDTHADVDSNEAADTADDHGTVFLKPDASLIPVESESKETLQDGLRTKARGRTHGHVFALISTALETATSIPFKCSTCLRDVLVMIDELIVTLEREGEEEWKKKEWCVGSFKTSDEKIKEIRHQIELLKRKIRDLEAQYSEVKHEKSVESTKITEITTTITKIETERKMEHHEYVVALSEQTAAIQILKYAMTRMIKFYDPENYTPGGSADCAVFLQHEQNQTDQPLHEQVGYQPSQEGATVISMIQMLIKDVEGSISELETVEKTHIESYKKTITQITTTRKEITVSKTSLVQGTSTMHEDVVRLKEELSLLIQSLESELATYRDLESQCSWLVQHFDLRVEARTSEIAALRKAKVVLKSSQASSTTSSSTHSSSSSTHSFSSSTHLSSSSTHLSSSSTHLSSSSTNFLAAK